MGRGHRLFVGDVDLVPERWDVEGVADLCSDLGRGLASREAQSSLLRALLRAWRRIVQRMRAVCEFASLRQSSPRPWSPNGVCIARR